MIRNLLYFLFIGWWRRTPVDQDVHMSIDVQENTDLAQEPEPCGPPQPLTKRQGQEKLQQLMQSAVDRPGSTRLDATIQGTPFFAGEGDPAQGLGDVQITTDVAAALYEVPMKEVKAADGRTYLMVDSSEMAMPQAPVDNSEFPAYLAKLHDEAKKTPLGKFIKGKRKAAEEYAEETGKEVPRPHRREINPTIVGHAGRVAVEEALETVPESRNC